MSKKDYIAAAKMIQEYRKTSPGTIYGEDGDISLEQVAEDMFVEFFQTQDRTGKFDEVRFREACQVKS